MSRGANLAPLFPHNGLSLCCKARLIPYTFITPHCNIDDDNDDAVDSHDEVPVTGRVIGLPISPLQHPSCLLQPPFGIFPPL